MTRTEEISSLFLRWLDRFTPPTRLKANDQARQDEAESLFKVLLRSAPQTGYADWVAGVLLVTEGTMKTRAWPTVHELGAACANSRKKPTGPKEEVQFDHLRINANRIHAGESVGDGYLYGRAAHEMIAKGYILEGDLDRHRSSLFFGMKKIWGEQEALRIEFDLKRRHALAAEYARLT